MTKIRSKPHIGGHEKESSWPSRFGTGGKGRFHLDDNGVLQEGNPPQKVVKYGEAPYVIQDSIEPYYHPGLCKTVETRRQLYDADRATGTITTDKPLKADDSQAKAVRAAKLADIKEATRKAVTAVDWGNAPLSEETKAYCKEENERISKQHGIDAFNVAGEKKK